MERESKKSEITKTSKSKHKTKGNSKNETWKRLVRTRKEKKTFIKPHLNTELTIN